MNLPDMQRQVFDYCKDRGLSSDVSVRIIDLVSEVGELSKEILKGTNYGKKQFEKTKDWQSEIGDVI